MCEGKCNPKESQLIQALKFADNHPQGFTHKQLEKYLDTEQGRWSDELKQQFGNPNNSNQRTILFVKSGQENHEKQPLYVLSVDGTKMLFDIIEIREAKKQALWATALACLSIGIAFFAAIPEIVGLLYPTIIQFEESQLLEIRETFENFSTTP